MRFTPSTITERSPSWSPWESHPNDDRRRVSHVLCAGGVAATTSAGLGVALAKAVLDANIRSIPATHGDILPANTSGPGGAETPRGPDDDLLGGVASA